MPRNTEVRMRITNDQLDRIKMGMQAKGFKTLSGYMRYLCLEYNQYLEAKILENNKILKEIVKILNSKN